MSQLDSTSKQPWGKFEELEHDAKTWNMMNYAMLAKGIRSGEALWRLVAVLTRKSLVIGYMGVRLVGLLAVGSPISGLGMCEKLELRTAMTPPTTTTTTTTRYCDFTSSPAYFCMCWQVLACWIYTSKCTGCRGHFHRICRIHSFLYECLFSEYGSESTHCIEIPMTL